VAILSHPSTTPPRGSLLYAVEVPYNEHGEALGETLFVSSAAAYEALPAARQQQLLGLRAMHRAGAKQSVPGSQLADAVKDLPDVIHPVIRTHPLTGRRAVYVRAGECVGIVGMPDAEALPLIQELSDFVTRPEFLYRHQWRVGDLLMWDNCCAQHLAVKDYDLPQRRLMHRVTVNGSVLVQQMTPAATQGPDGRQVDTPCWGISTIPDVSPCGIWRVVYPVHR
jgi:taurine dioxygenase